MSDIMEEHASRKLAIFDLDYTLTKRGTWGRFSWQLIRNRPHIWLPFLASALSAQRRYKAGKLPRAEVKKAMMRWSMKGKSKEELVKAAQKFADAEVPKKLRPGGIKTLKQHQAIGDGVIIISAAVDILVKEIAERLSVNYYLATDMAWDKDGIVKMEFASPNCYGKEKPVRFGAFLQQYPDYQSLPKIMYSDSHSDIYLMRKCEEAVAVHPSQKLKILASEYGFPVANWE